MDRLIENLIVAYLAKKFPAWVSWKQKLSGRIHQDQPLDPVSNRTNPTHNPS